MPYQIFISYARLDDRPPPESKDAKGFVSVLYEHLRYHFDELGPPKPDLWRDKRSIEPSDQFDPILAKAVQSSDLLLVILSLNWLDRPWCRKELELFAERWKKEGESGIKSRIVVVGKRYVDPDKRPALLQGQEGYAFYEREPDAEPGRETEYFRRGKAEPQFFDVAEDLAKSLWRRAGAKAAPKIESEPPAPKAGGAPGRTIYVAKPAADMRADYQRLVQELSKRDYAVVPAADAEIPHEDRQEAIGFIADALAGAELSIHLLGEKLGYVPDEGDPIGKLQLSMAADRVKTNAQAEGAHQPFCRYIWAPKFMLDRNGDGVAPAERDPFAVLEHFGQALLETDTLAGSEPTVFVNDVLRYLEQSARAAAPEPLGEGAEVYLCHREDDTDWAIEVASALQKQKIGARFPAFDTDAAEVSAVHRKALETCDAVVLCWANAGEAWVKAQSAELKTPWDKLGRERRFAVRSVVAGPPPGSRKNVFSKFPPPNEIDLVLDLTGAEQPTAEALEPLVRATRSEAANEE